MTQFNVGDKVRLSGPHTANGGTLYTREASLGDQGVISRASGSGTTADDVSVRWIKGNTSVVHPSCLALVDTTPTAAQSLRAEAKALRKKAKRLDKAAALVEEVSK